MPSLLEQLEEIKRFLESEPHHTMKGLPMSKKKHQKLPKRRGSKRGKGRDIPPHWPKWERFPEDDPDKPDRYTVS